MKKLICFLVIGLFSCQKEKKPDERPASDIDERNTWVAYEGRVPLTEKTNLYMEVSMLAADQPGEGFFIINEFVETDYVYVPASSFEGNYSTLYGEIPDERTIQFHNSALSERRKKTNRPPSFKGNLTETAIEMIRKQSFRATDLAVKIVGNTLVVLDQNQKAITLDPAFNLTKRSSKLFTLEGYFIYKGDTSEFFEMNTREQWAVSKLGEYYHAIRLYHKLTKNKFEVTYLKATGFSIEHTNKKGSIIDALVLKKVLQMTSSPSLTDEYNSLEH